MDVRSFGIVAGRHCRCHEARISQFNFIRRSFSVWRSNGLSKSQREMEFQWNFETPFIAARLFVSIKANKLFD